MRYEGFVFRGVYGVMRVVYKKWVDGIRVGIIIRRLVIWFVVGWVVRIGFF